MIAIESNLLIYSHREDSEFHRAAKELIDSLRHQSGPWAIPWPCIHEFIGIATHPVIYKPASTLSEALGFLSADCRQNKCRMQRWFGRISFVFWALRAIFGSIFCL